MIGETTKRILRGFGALAIVHSAAWAQNATAPLLGDAFINPGSASNFGATVNLNVGGPAGSQGLIQFDLSKVTVAPASIAVASLRLFVNRVTTPGSVDIYSVNGSWAESSVNGLSGGPIPGALVANAVPVTVSGSYIVIPVTAQVQSWLGGSPNNGLIIVQHPATTTYAFFDTKENSSTSHPAVLEIDVFGQAGTPGTPGTPGAPGLAGPTGPTGATGPAGPSGAQGAAGAAGLAGALGPQGPAGPTGPSGAQGATGAAGLAGAAGPTGASGPAGPTGAAGATGATGPNGSAGPAGATGAPGAAGAAGATGPPGVINNSFTILTGQSGNFTIASSETHNSLTVANAVGNGGNLSNSITLPSAGSVASGGVGPGYTILVSVTSWGILDGTLQFTPHSGDTIIDQNFSLSPFPINYQAEFISDGNHHWYIVLID